MVAVRAIGIIAEVGTLLLVIEEISLLVGVGQEIPGEIVSTIVPDRLPLTMFEATVSIEESRRGRGSLNLVFVSTIFGSAIGLQAGHPLGRQVDDQ